GAFTLAGSGGGTRRGARRSCVEAEADVVQLVRSRLGLRTVPRLKVGIADGGAAGALLRDDSADLFVLDAFTGAVMPVELATVEYLEDVARVVRGGGTVLVNLADGKGLAFARRFMATITEAFPHVALLADPGVLRGRRFGNIIVAASRVSLPLDGLIRRAAGGPARARCMHGRALTDFIAGAAPIHDGDAVTPPVPPPAVFGR